MVPRTESVPPSAPRLDGYRDPTAFTYPRLRLQAAGLVATLLAAVAGMALTAIPRGGSVSVSVGPTAFVGLGLALVATVLAHEGVHAAVARLRGYRITAGLDLRLPGAYVAALEQAIPRRDQVLVALAPLVVLTTLLAPLLLFAEGWLLGAALVGFVMNTAGAVGDVYVAWRALRLPPGTVFYDVSVDEMYVYEPR
ncbi:DUF3267 domain-containing protein [Halomarina ordinaria]|uniref:DUF3267 domain-containing protein n=1 Tax=Halomarina ordinaria TaxID=3033939 RepID=A0ABD5U7M1_9EURY|nr:DUF3267 domain-containing protein [Halomarina sp. PSRA2]